MAHGDGQTLFPVDPGDAAGFWSCLVSAALHAVPLEAWIQGNGYEARQFIATDSARISFWVREEPDTNPRPCEKSEGQRFRAYSAVTASVCAASASAGLTTHLVTHYALDGNAYDTGPFANHGVVYEAGVTADRFGREGRALTFDGFNDYVRIADSESLNLTGDFTISAWIRTHDPGSIIFSSMLEISPHDGYSLRLGLAGE